MFTGFPAMLQNLPFVKQGGGSSGLVVSPPTGVAKQADEASREEEPSRRLWYGERILNCKNASTTCALTELRDAVESRA
jgi:hypothetical protein